MRTRTRHAHPAAVPRVPRGTSTSSTPATRAYAGELSLGVDHLTRAHTDAAVSAWREGDTESQAYWRTWLTCAWLEAAAMTEAANPSTAPTAPSDAYCRTAMAQAVRVYRQLGGRTVQGFWQVYQQWHQQRHQQQVQGGTHA